MAKIEICTSAAGLLLLGALTAQLGCVHAGQSPAVQGATAAATPEATAAQTPEPNSATAAPSLLHVEPTDTPSGVFMRQGKPFCFAGSNNYYLTFKDKAMVDDVFVQAKALGLKVLRTWSFIDRGSLDDSVPSTDRNPQDPPGTKDGVYFQYWDTRAKATAYNDGAEHDDGLSRLDYVLAKAAENGIEVVLVLTNNWKEFGGMDQYLNWFGLKWHHQFYTDPKARAAYKHYAEHLIHRVNTITKVAYKDDPTIFAWELANEPRCRNFGKYDRLQDCKVGTLTAWVKEMSGYIKSIDPNHLVAVGDEGFFNRPRAAGSEASGAGPSSGGPSSAGLSGAGPSSEQYNGTDGVDHEAYLALDGIDYGTFHLYPDTWSKGLDWSNTWITDHIEAAQRAGKPTVLEEYGVVVKRDDKTGKVTGGLDRRRTAYTNWNQLLLERGGNAAMFWLLVGIDPHDTNTGYYPDYDHFSVYNVADDASATLLRDFAGQFAEHARACELAAKAGLSVAPSPFVSVLRRSAVAQTPVGLSPRVFAAR